MFEGYENNHDKALGLISWQALQIESLEKRLEISEGMLKTGAWEKSDAVKKQQVLLQSVRRDIHDKAVFPYARGIDPFISIKVVDAIIGNYLRELEGKRSSE